MSHASLERILTDFATEPLPETVKRDVRLLSMKGKADTLIGMRRSGKTYLMYDRMRELEAAGIPRSRIMYLSLDDERLGEPTLQTLDAALETFYRLNPDSRGVESYVFLDEIQLVEGWERFVRRVLDTENVQIALTGSSAKLLSTEVRTSLRGRGNAVEVLPYGLREAMRAGGFVPDEPPLSSRDRSRVASFAEEYLLRGGFPEVQSMVALNRVQTLHDYVEIVILRDIVERHDVSNVRALRHLVRAAFAANANQLSVSSLHGTLVSQGVKVAKNTLFDYLDHATDAYMCFLVPIRSRSEKQRIVNPKKVYAIDTGLASAMATGGAVNTGALLENAVYLELRRRLGRLATDAVSFYRTASGLEVDFAIEPVLPGDTLGLVQSCADIADEATCERELRALGEAMSETGVDHATVITLHDSAEVSVPAGTVDVVPFWEWALAGPIR